MKLYLTLEESEDGQKIEKLKEVELGVVFPTQNVDFNETVNDMMESLLESKNLYDTK